MSHTPGPWMIEAATKGTWNPLILAGGASVGGPGVVGVASLVGRVTEIDANARLIAAAPEMFDALKYIVEWNPRDWSAEKARELARAALAKAST